MAARAPEEPGFLPPERKDLPKNRPGESIRVGQKLNAIFAGMPPKVADRMKKPYSSRGDMRYRTPFADVVAVLKAKLAAQENPAGEGEGNSAAVHWTEERVDELLADMENAELAARIRETLLSE